MLDHRNPHSTGKNKYIRIRVVKQVRISFARWEALALLCSVHEVYMIDAYRKLYQDLYNYQQQVMHSYYAPAP